jgi:hypothetical protein
MSYNYHSTHVAVACRETHVNHHRACLILLQHVPTYSQTPLCCLMHKSLYCIRYTVAAVYYYTVVSGLLPLSVSCSYSDATSIVAAVLVANAATLRVIYCQKYQQQQFSTGSNSSTKSSYSDYSSSCKHSVVIAFPY